MDQFVNLVILGLGVWLLVTLSSRNKSSSSKASNRLSNQVKGSTFNLNGEYVTVSLIDPKGKERISKFSVFEIEKINLMKPTQKKNGKIQFILKSGLSTEPLEIDSKYRDALDEAISEIEQILASGSGSEFAQTRNDKSSNKTPVHFDGRLKTQELEYLAADAASPYQQTVIQLDDPEFAFVDVETTGLHFERGDRIVEVGVVITNSSGEFLSEWSSTINPGRRISATHIHGLTDSDFTDSPNLGEVGAQLLELLSGRIFVAHNASFDYKFIQNELKSYGYELDPARFAVFDTMSLATKILPGLPNKKMETLIEAINLDISTLPGRGPHSALTDAYAGAHVLALYLRNNRQAVLDAVTWPLIAGWSKPKILTTEEFLGQEESKSAENTFMSALASEPSTEILIQKNTEVYFTGFMSEQEYLIDRYTRQWKVTRAERVTKKRCSLVVTAETERASNAVKNAMKWDIPVVALIHIEKVVTSD